MESKQWGYHVQGFADTLAIVFIKHMLNHTSGLQYGTGPLSHTAPKCRKRRSVVPFVVELKLAN